MNRRLNVSTVDYETYIDVYLHKCRYKSYLKMLEWVIFILVCFLYIHIIQQYKCSDQMDVYEYEYVNNTQLQETCNLLQPFVFPAIPYLPSIPNLDDMVHNDTCILMYDDSEKDPIQLPFSTAKDVLETSNKRAFFTEYNQDLISESTTLQEVIKTIDPLLMPPFTIGKFQDVRMGSRMSHTAFKYHTDTRKFLYVNGGTSTDEIRVKLTPWKKYANVLQEIRDYERGEYRSKLNVWEKHSIDGISFLEIAVLPNNVLYIPPYWGYSIQYTSSKIYIVEFTYNTILNTVAFSGEFARKVLQQQNIYKKVYQSLEVTKSQEPSPDSNIVVLSTPVDDLLPDNEPS